MLVVGQKLFDSQIFAAFGLLCPALLSSVVGWFLIAQLKWQFQILRIRRLVLNLICKCDWASGQNREREREGKTEERRKREGYRERERGRERNRERRGQWADLAAVILS